jgi:hypothetical protein
MTRPKHALLLALLMVFISLSAAAIVIFDITSPIDKTETLSTRADIVGTVAGARDVDINGTTVDLDRDGKFNAIALLRPGKNFILVIAKYAGERRLTKKIRVLRIISCDDIEELFKGKAHWAKQQVLTLLTLGIIEGYPDNTFLPGRPLSRGEFATWLAKAKQLKLPVVTADIFYDVPKEHWRAPYIKAVVDAGYMTGVAADMFGISNLIKRGDAVAVVARANDLAPLNLQNSPFYDVPLDSNDAAFIYSAYNEGWIKGYPGKIRKFEPEKDMTRGEVAVLLSRLWNVRELRLALYDFEKEYTAYQYCKVSTKPVINTAAAVPAKIAADGKTPLKLSAKVTDAQGVSDVSQVWADLISLGGPNNAKMNLMVSGLYEISFVITSETVPGEKNIAIRALDKSGLKSDISVVKVIVTKEKQ